VQLTRLFHSRLHTAGENNTQSERGGAAGPDVETVHGGFLFIPGEDVR